MQNKAPVKTHKRLSSLLTFAALGILTLTMALSQHAHAESLKSQALITGNMITLGDLFDGLTQDKDRVLGPAPQPGKEMILNARTLMRVASAFNLSWRPKTSYDQITLSRDATIIGGTEIERVVRNQLKQDGVNGSFKVSFYQAYPKIILPGNIGSNVAVKSINFDPNKNNFSVLLAAPNVENPIQTLELSGEIVKTVSIPVATNTVQNGDLIDKNMISWVEIEERQMQSDTITSFNALHNMTPKRVLFSGKPISAGDIMAPRLVERGSEVTMIYKSGGMNLTARGKALQSGSKGEVIRVMNTASARPIEATVTDSRMVTVYN
jgi:flagella basal body P-ring formation protein FlgA